MPKRHRFTETRRRCSKLNLLHRTMSATISMTPTDEQFADPDFKRMIAHSYAEKLLEAQREEVSEFLGGAVAIPISFAVRLTGWNEKWIRRNLPIIQAEGLVASVQLSDIKHAIETRKS